MSTTYIPLAMKFDAMLSRVEVRMVYRDGVPFLIVGVFCTICDRRIVPGQRIHFDHIHCEGLGGKTTYQDLRPVHAEKHGEFACHRRKTSGTKATSAGSDVHMIAKTRPDHADKFKVNKPPPGERPPRAARYRRRMNGTVERRDA